MINSATALSPIERNALTQALREELDYTVRSEEVLEMNSYHLTTCLLAVSLRTGRITTPLLNMEINCLRDHPLKDIRACLSWSSKGVSLVGIGRRRYCSSVTSVARSHFLTVLGDKLVNLTISLMDSFSRKYSRRTFAYILMVITS